MNRHFTVSEADKAARQAGSSQVFDPCPFSKRNRNYGSAIDRDGSHIYPRRRLCYYQSSGCNVRFVRRSGPSGLQPANARRCISTRKLLWILQHGCRRIGNNGGLPVPTVIRCRSKEERKAKKTKCVLAMAKPEKADGKPLRRQYFSCRVSILEIFHSPTTLEKK
jgi:hypothetical protein